MFVSGGGGRGGRGEEEEEEDEEEEEEEEEDEEKAEAPQFIFRLRANRMNRESEKRLRRRVFALYEES